MIRRLALALLFTSSPLAAQHAAGSSRPALTPAPEARQFDFLVGQWDLVVMPKATSLAAKIHGAPRLLGTWKAWRAVDGFGIEDELRIVDASGNPSSLSQAIRVYNANEKKWIVTGIDAYRGRASSATGDLRDGELLMNGQGVDEQGKPYLTRTRYYDITAASFKYSQDRSTDNGKTWDEGLVKIQAKRVAAAALR